MKKLILLPFLVLFFSCAEKKYIWNGEKVSFRKYRREFSKDVDLFIKKYNPKIILNDKGQSISVLDSTHNK